MTAEENRQEIINDSIAYGCWTVLAALLLFVSNTIAVDCFNLTALRQIKRIRIKLLESLMRQDVGWYDVLGDENNCVVHITECVLIEYLFLDWAVSI